MDCKQSCRFLPHGNKGLHKLWTPMKHVESNVQSLMDLCVDTMLHQMKGI
jgi:hypothetical protein